MSLSALGEKIFLDRYALKETDRDQVRLGDTVMVTIQPHPKWPVRAVGKVIEFLPDDPERVRVEYRNVDGEMAQGIFAKRTLDICRETIEQATRRVAQGLAKAEKAPLYWADQFWSVLDPFYFVPAGRIYTGAGTDLNVTYFNCFVLPSPHDSRKGIFTRLAEMAEVLARGGGVGINFSTLRPRDSIIRGTMGRSSGSVSWAQIYSVTIVNTSQGGSRRGAGMAQWEIWHPDILEVIDCKRTPGVMEGFNISIRVSDEFMNAVKHDQDWTFMFPDTAHPNYDAEWDGDLKGWMAKGYPVIKYQTIKARELWDKMMQSAYASAEPGIVFSDRVEQESNSWYFSRLPCSNPCGEQNLPHWGVCTLGHINLANMLNHGQVDWARLERTITLAVRMLDNVIDVTPYFFAENERVQKSERRIGLGTLGLGEMLIRLGIRYGANKECIQFLDKLYSFIACKAYEASIELAREKGAFPLFDADKFLRSGFMKRIVARFPHLAGLIRANGIRNVTLITQAPTGTVGSMLNTSTGIEPFFAIKYTRQSRLGVDVQYMDVAREWLDAHPGEALPDYFVGAMDITPEDHLAVQAIVQQWTDSACSKTANFPSTATVEDVANAYWQAYEKGCKGFTVYVDGSRYEQVLTVAQEEPAKKSEPTVITAAVKTTQSVDADFMPKSEPLDASLLQPHDFEHFRKTGEWNCPNGGEMHAESGCYHCTCGGFAVCG